LKEKGERGFLFIRALLVFAILILIVASSGAAWGAPISQEKFIQLNPEVEELFFYSITSPLSFHFDQGGKNLLLIQVTFSAKDDSWGPWLNQAEGEPVHLLGDGFLYSQYIFFAPPDQAIIPDFYHYKEVIATGGKVAEAFGTSLPLNFYDLQAINPGFKYYKKLSSQGDQQSPVFLFAPDGMGLMFLGLENGDIFALVLRDPERWRQITGTEGHHTELGTFRYSEPFYLAEPGFSFEVSRWFSQMRAEEQKTEVGAVLDDDFVLEGLEVKMLMGMLQVESRITNYSGKNFSVIIFEVIFFDEDGQEVAHGGIMCQDLRDGETGDFLGMFVPEGNIDPENIRYSITLSQAW